MRVEPKFLGMMTAQVVGPLILTGVTKKSEQLLLVARFQDERKYEQIDQLPLRKARYNVEIAATGEVKGVAEIVDYDKERKSCLLECVDERVPDYWNRLAEVAVSESAPPSGIILQPYELVPIRVTDTQDRPAIKMEGNNAE